MTTSLWHRFPAGDLHALRAALSALAEASSEVLHDDEAARIRALLQVVERGFECKQDLDLDVELLARCLEYDVVTCDSRRRQQLRVVLRRLRTHRRTRTGVKGG
ncbi:MAG: hypothetical protein ABIJ09_05595 [Pseudomonadota bacterium]